MTGVLQKGEIWKQTTHRESTIYRWRQGSGWCFYKYVQQTTEARWGAWARFSFSALRRNQHCQHLDLEGKVLASRTVRQEISIKCLWFVHFVQAAIANKYTISLSSFPTSQADSSNKNGLSQCLTELKYWWPMFFTFLGPLQPQRCLLIQINLFANQRSLMEYGVR